MTFSINHKTSEEEKMEMLDRCLRILVKCTPECNKCVLKHSDNTCFFASMCLLDESNELICYTEL